MAAICPLCQKDDLVKQVTAISAKDFSSDSGVNSTTDLPVPLRPPQKPSMMRSIMDSVSSAIGCGGIVLGAILACFGLRWLLTCDQCGEDIACILIIAGLLILIVGFLLPYFKVKKVNAAALVQWKRQMTVYERLYYCFRDSVTFDPETSQYRPLVESRQLFDQ